MLCIFVTRPEDPSLYLSATVDSRYLGLSRDLLPKIIFVRLDRSIYIACIYIYVWSMVCILCRTKGGARSSSSYHTHITTLHLNVGHRFGQLLLTSCSVWAEKWIRNSNDLYALFWFLVLWAWAVSSGMWADTSWMTTSRGTAVAVAVAVASGRKKSNRCKSLMKWNGTCSEVQTNKS